MEELKNSCCDSCFARFLVRIKVLRELKWDVISRGMKKKRECTTTIVRAHKNHTLTLRKLLVPVLSPKTILSSSGTYIWFDAALLGISS